jgi:hypothetical protein
MASAALLVTGYYLLPFDHVSNTASVVALAFGLVGVALIVAWEVRAIVTAEYPAIRGIQALATTLPLFLLLFSATYYLMAHSTPSDFSQEHLTRTDALYFTVTTFSTVGYGDITATSQGARLVVTVQMLADLAVLGFGVRVLLGAVQTGRQRRAEHEGDPPA